MDAQDFRSLQEAYIGVYDDDIREKLEFESWVNNLLEEGYDLSDYTWDELYENYTQLDEISDRRVQQTLRARQRRFNRSIDSGAPNKEFHQLRNTEKLVASRNKRTGSNIKVDENHQESYDLYDIILSHLIDEGYAETPEAAERIMVNMSEEWKETILEITGGKGHPGYKAGSRDLGPMQSGHPADSSKRTMKGGTMSMRHGDHLGDLDDDDDDDDGLEAGLKDSARKSMENVRKPLRNMVKTAAKRLNK